MQLSTTLLCAMAAAGARAQGPTHRRFSFDFGWRFHLGPMANDSAPCDIIVGRDIGTGYIELSMKASADACCAACASVTSCAAWDWMSVPPFTCFLKNNTAGNVSRSGRATGLAPPRTPDPVAPNFDDSTWARVDLPHDYAINGTFLPTEDANHAYLPKPPSWYRKNFTLDHSLRGGTLFFSAMAPSAMRACGSMARPLFRRRLSRATCPLALTSQPQPCGARTTFSPLQPTAAATVRERGGTRVRA